MIKDILVKIAEDRAIEEVKKIEPGKVETVKNPKTIIFNRVYTTFTKTFYHEVGIAKALQLSGHKVLFLVCDKRMEKCTPVFTTREGKDKFCDRCQSFGKRFLDACGIPYKTYTEIFTENTEFPYFVNFTSVYNSMERYYKGIKKFNVDEYAKIFEIRLRNAKISRKVAEIIYEKEKPDVIFSTHYGYSEWSPFNEYMKEKGVRTIVWDYIYGSDYMVFDMEKLGDVFDKHKDKPLSPIDQLGLDEYMRERKTGKADTQTYKFDTKKYLTRPGYKNVYAMFPNLPWDTSLQNANKIFSSVYHWIDDTIEFFKKHPENYLFIKIHPAEVVDKSYKTVGDYIDEYHNLTNNIGIIEVSEQISAYNLYKIIDAGIVYNGTAGIEMSLDGVPAIVVGNIYYSEKDFTYDPQSIDEYHKLLEKAPPKLNENQMKMAYKFASFYFDRSRVPMFYVVRGFLGHYFCFNDFEDLLAHYGIKQTIRYIVDGEEYQYR